MSLRDRLIRTLHGPVYRRRTQGLCAAIVPHLRSGDRVLDVGCGSGVLGRSLMDHPACPAGVTVRGLERARRGDEAIPVDAYDGKSIPFASGTFDVVIVADVLHHEQEPDQLIAELTRVAARRVIIKDHKLDGVLAWHRISLMDWAANTAYGVPCLFRYPTLKQWQQTAERHGLRAVDEIERMQLYPYPYRLVFTPSLQYFAVLDVAAAGQPSADRTNNP